MTKTFETPKPVITSIRMRQWLTVLLMVLCSTQLRASDSIYQYAVHVGDRTAYLWVPPHCVRIRGVIVAFSNMLERQWLEDPIVRTAADDECLGTIWIGPGKNSPLNAEMSEGSSKAFDQMMRDFASDSGFAELAWAPVIPTGHSAQGHFAWTFAKAEPQRTIAAIAIKTVPFPATLDLPGIPLLYMVGETTEWPQYRDGRVGDRDFFWPVIRDSAIRLRKADPNNLIGVVTDPGGGHFDWSEKQSQFLALFIRKACNYRLPQHGSPHSSPVLQPIREQGGWLSDTGGVRPDQYAPAPAAGYRGDKSRTYWFFDRETAEAAARFDGDRKQRERQMLTFEQDGSLLPVAKEGFAALKLEQNADGITFDLKPGYLQSIPPELVNAGRPLNHSNGPVRLAVITGPAVQVGPDEFRLAMYRGNGAGALWAGDVWIEEYQEGDEQFRKAVQPGRLRLPPTMSDGRPQQITFDLIPDIATGTVRVPLHAGSTSGLPVRWYVDYGPARVEGDTLVIDQLPRHAKKPLEIRIVAYQFGRAGEFQTAPPVVRTFHIKVPQRQK